MPSIERAASTGGSIPTTNCSLSFSRFFCEIFVIASMLTTRFLYTQSAICFAVNAGIPTSATASLNCPSVIPKNSLFALLIFVVYFCTLLQIRANILLFRDYIIKLSKFYYIKQFVGSFCFQIRRFLLFSQ